MSSSDEANSRERAIGAALLHYHRYRLQAERMKDQLEKIADELYNAYEDVWVARLNPELKDELSDYPSANDVRKLIVKYSGLLDFVQQAKKDLEKYGFGDDELED